MSKDDDDFRIRLGQVRDCGGGLGRGRGAGRSKRGSQTFIGQVHAAIRRAGGDPNRPPGAKAKGRFNARGRGAAISAAMKDRSPWRREASGVRTRARRVAVKARVVKLNPQRGAARGRGFVSAKAVVAHLRYLERDGVDRNGEKGRLYSAGRDVEDGQAFLDRGREDRHQFRFIVSPEDGADLADPMETTRALMRQMEADLGTKLDWVAVDHFNTGHPHTHVLVRGITDDGKILNIAGDYIAHGIRERASEIVTLELGRQTEKEVTKSLEPEVEAERFTRLDRMLIAEQQASDEWADLRPDKDMLETLRQNRALLIQRARVLEQMGLAAEAEPGRWIVFPEAEDTLRDLGQQRDIIKTMHKALERAGLAEERAPGSYVLHRERTEERITGRVLDKGLASDELGERVRLVIDGVDGKIHHLELDAARAEEIAKGMVIAAGSGPEGPRPSDRNIAEIAGLQGIYRTDDHLLFAREDLVSRGVDPEAFVQSHVRRLEALRRAGIVLRMDDGVWEVPRDLVARGQAYDQARDPSDLRVRILSPFGLDRQVRHEGATWLDRELVAGRPTPLSDRGFGHDVQVALEQRRRTLLDAGHVRDLGGGRMSAPKDLIQRLEAIEIDKAGKALAAERGRSWSPSIPGQSVTGKLTGSVQLASGRFAMIDDGLGFSLVPWRHVLEPHVGREVSGIALPGGGIDWMLGRKRDLGLSL
ncbi:DUF3363 domain-containing protein [Phenylobacterium montanum]|uniref:Relaxase/mobilization nuclease and DUF3363 domain-containing protein n=1 Tax=Phenylobacterium montanum TaxID=2823693 RepID=A0A975FV49_9CAUL|nr:DUF3363 domain-containing protein [Caulobacter sp. S6]QUD86053.1 relaxase/mobilization nuclease and DUF3363 domain-containing protein [Caulobacter sp. S6]